MPKHELQDRFRIHFEVSKQDVGEWLSTLVRAGINNVGYELITDIKAWKKNSKVDPNTGEAMKRAQFDISGKDVVLGMFASGRPITSKEIAQRFEAEGRTPNSCSPIINDLMKRKYVKRIDAGKYQLIKSPAAKAAVKQLKARGNGSEATVTAHG